MMQLLTAQLRARIESIVLDAISRLPPNITPSDPRFLEWIESLIRYRTREPLDPTEKPPVLGGIGIADKHVRGSMGESFLLMDSGWIASAAESTFPLGIYLGDADMAYLTEGTMVPQGEPPNQWLIPSVTYHEERLDWPAVPPVTTMQAGSNVYESPRITDETKVPPSETDPPSIDPALHTGLLKLAKQAKIGAGFSVTELLWELAQEGTYSASSGLIHNEDFVFYKIAVESNGALARKMKNTFATDWIVDQFVDGNLGEYGDVAYRMFMSWLLMDLTVDDEASNLTLLTALELEDVYDGRQPLAHGWHWNRSAPFEGSVVTVQEQDQSGTWWIECTLARIDIEFNGTTGDPEMTLELETEDEKAGPKLLQPLWIENPDGGVDPVVPPVGRGIANEGDETTVYCFYREMDDGTQERWELFWTIEAEEERAALRELCYACGLIGKGYNNWWDEGTFTFGGWSVSDLFRSDRTYTYADASFGAAKLQNITNLLISQEGHKTGEHIVQFGCYPAAIKPSSGSCGDGTHPGETCTGPAQSDPYPDPPEGTSECGGEVLYETGNAVYQRFDEIEEVQSFRNFAIIPAGDAEAVLIGKAKERGYSKRNRQWEYECCLGSPLRYTPITHYWNDGSGPVNIGPLPAWNQPLFPNCFGAGGICGGDDPNFPPVDEWIPAWGLHNETIVHTIRSAGDPIDANQDYDGDENDFYAAWLVAYQADTTTPHEGWNTPTMNSFTGNGVVYTEIPDEKKMLGGYPQFDHEDFSGTTVYFSGWA